MDVDGSSKSKTIHLDTVERAEGMNSRKDQRVTCRHRKLSRALRLTPHQTLMDHTNQQTVIEGSLTRNTLAVWRKPRWCVRERISKSWPTLVMQAVKTLVDRGYDPKIIDIRSLKPFDMYTIRESVKKTHRVLIVEEYMDRV